MSETKNYKLLLLIIIFILSIILFMQESTMFHFGAAIGLIDPPDKPDDVVAISISNIMEHKTTPSSDEISSFPITDPEMIKSLLDSVDWLRPRHKAIFARYEHFVFMKTSDGTVERWALRGSGGNIYKIDGDSHPYYYLKQRPENTPWDKFTYYE